MVEAQLAASVSSSSGESRQGTSHVRMPGELFSHEILQLLLWRDFGVAGRGFYQIMIE
jgi:hypothetical protein